MNIFCRVGEQFPGRVAAGGGYPAILVDCAVAEDFEILLVMAGLRRGVGESGHKAVPFQRQLLCAIDHIGEFDAGGVEDGGHHVIDVGELLPHRLGLRGMAGPVDHEAVTRAAEMGGDLLHPLERPAGCPGPGGGVMIIEIGAAEIVEMREHAGHVVFRAGHEAEIGIRAIEAAFGAAAVVADHV